MTTRTVRPSVAIVAHAIHDSGGMERVFYELIRNGHRRYRFVVLSGRLAPELRPLVEWRRIHVPRRPIPLLITAFFVLGGLRLLRTSVDLVHTQGALVPNRASVISVHFCHAGFREAACRLVPSGSPPLRRLNHAMTRLLALAGERWCYRPERTRIFAAVSSRVADELRRHYPGVPVVITPNGVDTNRFRPDEATREALRREEGVRTGETIALFVGGDWDRKGLAVTIRALAEARLISRMPIRLWVVGRGDDRRFGALAQAHGVEDLVRFFGQRRDTERFYQAADIFVMPTSYEAAPLVGYEAAACSLPIIATRVGGIEDLVGEDDAGLLVDRSPRIVGAALATLASDRDLCKRMGEASRRRASELTWERSAAAVLEVYEEVLDGRPATAVLAR